MKLWNSDSTSAQIPDLDQDPKTQQLAKFKNTYTLNNKEHIYMDCIYGKKKSLIVTML